MTKDIEREAFEITYQPDPQKSPFPYFLFNEEKNLYEAHSFDGREVSLINAAWWGWQAAKAHESEKLKGCVVVPVEPTDLMINAYRDNSVAPISTLSVVGYKAMLEAVRGGNE